MVLQRGQPVPVWGTAKPLQSVTVTFNGQRKTTKANQSGEWKLNLDAMKAVASPTSLIISSGKEKIELKNILVGEVWLCSGQSNMEFAMRKISKLTPPDGANWPVDELKTAHNQNIRIFLVDRKRMSPDPNHLGWSIAQDSALRSFSAVGYFFAKELQQKLNVPVGVISAAIPGSRIEPWMPREAMASQNFFKEEKDATRKIDGDPGKFYETMIQPLVPFSLKGFLWYQGESNCFLNERLQYAYKMKALIEWWRKDWNNNALPFYYVQIAPYYYSKATDRPYTVYSEPEFWEAQTAVLKLPHTGMVSTIDLNDNAKDLHPVNKWDVGKRLAICALGNIYGQAVMPMGPVFEAMQVQGNRAVLSFKYADKGLKSNDNKDLNWFEIAGSNGKYFPATANIDGGKIIVSSEAVAKPVAVRFAWHEDAKPNLYNTEGLPAMPFRTDNPIEREFNK